MRRPWTNPYFCTARVRKCEHVTVKLQLGGPCGDTNTWYTRTKPLMTSLSSEVCLNVKLLALCSARAVRSCACMMRDMSLRRSVRARLTKNRIEKNILPFLLLDFHVVRKPEMQYAVGNDHVKLRINEHDVLERRVDVSIPVGSDVAREKVCFVLHMIG
jgi:hypothetical protein